MISCPIYENLQRECLKPIKKGKHIAQRDTLSYIQKRNIGEKAEKETKKVGITRRFTTFVFE